MTTCFLAPDPIQSTQFIPGGNTPANGGQLFFYTAGTSTKTTVYKDNAAAASWTNPLVLDSGGNLPGGGEVWFPQGIAFKVIFAPANDTDPPASPYWTKDNLAGINDISSGAGQEAWVTGPAPTFVGATQFRMSGDQTTTFTAGTRLQLSVTAGTIYGSVYASQFATGSTAVSVQPDSLNLDAGLSAVNYSFLTPFNTPVPVIATDHTLYEDPTNATKRVKFSASSIAVSTTVNLNFPVSSGSFARLEDLTYANTSGAQRLLFPNNWIEGGQINNSASSDAMNLGAIQTIDSNNAVNLISAGLNRKTTVSFSTGASSGAILHAGLISTGTWYAWYALGGSSGAVDFGADTLFPKDGPPRTTAAFPNFRYIGGRKTNSTSVWLTAVQHGNMVQHGSVTSTDVSTSGSLAASTVRMNVPPVVCEAIFHAQIIDQSGSPGSRNMVASFWDPALPDQVVSITTVPFADMNTPNDATSTISGIRLSKINCYTDSTGTIKFRTSLADSNTDLQLATLGWIDPRGRIVS